MCFRPLARPTHRFWMLVLLLGYSVTIFGESGMLLADFARGWKNEWEVKHLHRRPNRFDVSNENGNKVLRVYSSTSASGIFRKWEVDPLTSGSISWKWKVSTSLIHNRAEKTKRGDDYAARIFLLFEPHFFTWRTPNICYVWAGNEPAGNMFKSPHTGSVCTIVLQSGNAKSNHWLAEDRDFVKDYVDCFGRNPKKLSAVAIMVDTDDTASQATAWFDDVKITTNLKTAPQQTQ